MILLSTITSEKRQKLKLFQNSRRLFTLSFNSCDVITTMIDDNMTDIYRHTPLQSISVRRSNSPNRTESRVN